MDIRDDPWGTRGLSHRASSVNREYPDAEDVRDDGGDGDTDDSARLSRLIPEASHDIPIIFPSLDPPWTSPRRAHHVAQRQRRLHLPSSISNHPVS